MIATLLLAGLVVLALWVTAAPTAMAQEHGEGYGRGAADGGSGSGTSSADRVPRVSGASRPESGAGGPIDLTRGDRRSTRDRDAVSSPAPARRSPSRIEADEPPDRGETIRARTDALRHGLRERGAELRRKAHARAQQVRGNVRDGARQSKADSRSARSLSGDRTSATSDDAGVSIAARERIELLPGRRHILRGQRVLVRGYVPSGRSGRTVVLETLLGRSWFERDRALTGADGRFYLAWYPSHAGRFRARVRELRASSDTLPSNSRLLYVYRRAVASWYGPGFYGNRTACGQTFTSRLLGVAHRSLRCGYRVTVRYRGRSITVPVVDRGPYVRGRDYDLTNATKEYLRFEGVNEIWATA